MGRFQHPDEANKLFSRIRRNNMAKSAIEGALWDLYAKTQDKPLAEVVGGKKSEIAVGAVIAPKSTIESATAEGLTEFIGTGPYKLIEWKADQYVHLTKFEEYQSVNQPASGLAGKKEAFIDDIYFQFVTDASTRLAGIQSGEYDIANAISFDNAEQLATNSDVKNSVDHNGFNGVNTPMRLRTR